MTEKLQIFIEYKINENVIREYEEKMGIILATLPEYEASEIEWFAAADQPHLYVEMFKVPTKAHYIALKKYRQSNEHPVFGSIIPYIEGGSEKLHCWAFIPCKRP